MEGTVYGQSNGNSCAAVCRPEQRDRPAQAACWVTINSAVGGPFTIQQTVVQNLLHCHFMERDQKDSIVSIYNIYILHVSVSFSEIRLSDKCEVRDAPSANGQHPHHHGTTLCRTAGIIQAPTRRT